jgi:ketosteroid isomerase-like protein
MPIPAAARHTGRVTTGELLLLWFDAHRRGDVSAAKALVADDAEVVVPGASFHGFDAFMQWYRERAHREGPSFRYVIDDVLSGDHHASAVLTLSTDTRSWRQVALYRIADDKITGIWAVEHD